MVKMANWKENKVVGIVAGVILVIASVLIILNIVRTKSEERKILLKENPPAVIE